MVIPQGCRAVSVGRRSRGVGTGAWAMDSGLEGTGFMEGTGFGHGAWAMGSGMEGRAESLEGGRMAQPKNEGEEALSGLARYGRGRYEVACPHRARCEDTSRSMK